MLLRLGSSERRDRCVSVHARVRAREADRLLLPLLVPPPLLLLQLTGRIVWDWSPGVQRRRRRCRM